MKHLFDVDIAKSYGMDVAVFLENLSFWIVKNQANKEHFHDGRYWTYNTLDAFTEIFPYLTKKQIRRIVDKSFKEDLIVKGNYNQIGYDRTLWYSLSDKGHALLGIELCPNGKIEMPKWANRKDQKGSPIPYINTDNKPYIKDKIKAQPKKRVAVDPCIDPYVLKPIIEIPEWIDKDLWEEFKQHRKDIKKPMTALSQKKTINQLAKMREKGQDIEQVINNSIANGWQGVFEVKQHKEYGNGKDRNVDQQDADAKAKAWRNGGMWDYLAEAAGLREPKESGTNIVETQKLISLEDYLALSDSGTNGTSNESVGNLFAGCVR